MRPPGFEVGEAALHRWLADIRRDYGVSDEQAANASGQDASAASGFLGSSRRLRAAPSAVPAAPPPPGQGLIAQLAGKGNAGGQGQESYPASDLGAGTVFLDDHALQAERGRAVRHPRQVPAIQVAEAFDSHDYLADLAVDKTLVGKPAGRIRIAYPDARSEYSTQMAHAATRDVEDEGGGGDVANRSPGPPLASAEKLKRDAAQLQRLRDAMRGTIDDMQDANPGLTQARFDAANIEISPLTAAQAGFHQKEGEGRTYAITEGGKITLFQDFFTLHATMQVGLLFHEFVHTTDINKSLIEPKSSPAWELHHDLMPWEKPANEASDLYTLRHGQNVWKKFNK